MHSWQRCTCQQSLRPRTLCSCSASLREEEEEEEEALLTVYDCTWPQSHLVLLLSEPE
jgi:hypothetical protein